jgi:hypothetical protein
MLSLAHRQGVGMTITITFRRITSGDPVEIGSFTYSGGKIIADGVGGGFSSSWLKEVDLSDPEKVKEALEISVERTRATSSYVAIEWVEEKENDSQPTLA